MASEQRGGPAKWSNSGVYSRHLASSPRNRQGPAVNPLSTSQRRPLTAAFLSLIAASFAFGPVAVTPTVAPVEKITSTPAPATATNSPTEFPTSTDAPTVLLVAQGGNLHVRRGPGAGYNILAVLQNG